LLGQVGDADGTGEGEEYADKGMNSHRPGRLYASAVSSPVRLPALPAPGSRRSTSPTAEP
jgi:hypothetical protein